MEAMTDPNFTRQGAVDLSSLSSAAAQTGATYVLQAGEAEFNQLVSASMQHPVIVEFHSPRDPAGAAVSDTLARLVNEAEGRFLLARVDVDAEPRLAQSLGVQAVPMVVALIGGQLAPLFQGTRSAQEISPLLDQVTQLAVANGMTGRAKPAGRSEVAKDGAPAADPRFAAADAALESGDFAKAVTEFEKVLSATPNDPEALAGRAQAALLARSLAFDPAAIVRDAAALPGDISAQLDAADLEVIQGASAEAFDRLLGLAGELPAEEREPIRLRLLELFEVVGRTDPLVLRARRRLSTVLFAS